MTGPSRKQRLHFPRETVLVEIERRCASPDCETRNQVGLTKAEAIEYRGFECSKCKRWNNDRVNELELPETWIP
jgi:hypothetical protein